LLVITIYRLYACSVFFTLDQKPFVKKMSRRARPGEDDLEAMLAEFESGRVQPAAAATVVKRPAAEAAPPTVEAKKTKSKFARDRTSKRTGTEPSTGSAEAAEVKLEPLVEKAVDQLVLRGIVERDVGSMRAVPPVNSSWSQADFPPVLKFAAAGAGGENGGGGATSSKKSIFAQQFMKMKSAGGGGGPALDAAGAKVEKRAPPPLSAGGSSAGSAPGFSCDCFFCLNRKRTLMIIFFWFKHFTLCRGYGGCGRYEWLGTLSPLCKNYLHPCLLA
jgi:hypothetical protein